MSESSKVISTRVTAEEYARFSAEASNRGMTVGTYARQRLVGTVAATPSSYGMLTSRVETLEKALTLAGLDESITTARALLSKEAPHAKDQSQD